MSSEAGRGPLGHLTDLARFAFRRRSQERDNSHALRELQSVPLDLPKGLTIEWLGVAGFRLSSEAHTLVVDPYLSRITFADLIRRRPVLPDRPLVDRLLGDTDDKVVGVLAGHTHFDHALDVPAVAERFGCAAMGSRSLARLMAAHGMQNQAIEVRAHECLELGPFRVTFVPSRHSPIVLGKRVPMDGEIDARRQQDLHARAYRCGRVWSFLIEVAGARLYHQGSADLIDEEVPSGGVDVFLAGVAGREFTDHYWRRVLKRLDPAQVVICHHDDFFKPLDEPLAFAPNVRLAAIPEEVGVLGKDVRVTALPRIGA